MGAVRLEGVSKRFGDMVAVDDLNLEVADEEFLVLLGPSGCGKSTALRMIAGLEQPTSGDIWIGDRRVNDVAPMDRDVAMVFQSYALYPHMSVRENIEFPLKKRGVPGAQRAIAVTEAARALGLDRLLGRRPGKLSGGQRQRVALARAIVRRPQVFLMDEPLSNLDAKLRTQTRAELVELQRRLAGTFVYVTHDQVEAMTMGQRIAVMNDGVLQQVGPPQDVYDRPANVFVAQFLGSPPMNLFTGTVGDEPATGAVCRLASGGGLAVGPAQAAAARSAGLSTLTVGVRPEHLGFGSSRSGAPTVKAVARVVESLGHERLVACEVEPSLLVSVRLDASEPLPALDEVVHLEADPAHVHVFDPHSGRRLEPDPLRA